MSDFTGKPSKSLLSHFLGHFCYLGVRGVLVGTGGRKAELFGLQSKIVCLQWDLSGFGNANAKRRVFLNANDLNASPGTNLSLKIAKERSQCFFECWRFPTQGPQSQPLLGLSIS